MTLTHNSATQSESEVHCRSFTSINIFSNLETYSVSKEVVVLKTTLTKKSRPRPSQDQDQCLIH